MKCFCVLALALLPAARQETDRSPSDLALTPDGRRAVTANTTSDTASLVDLAEGKVVAEVKVGRRPKSVALSGDGSVAVVTHWLSDSVTVLRVRPSALEASATVAVGDEPRGVAVSPDGARAFVALSGEDAVAVVDLRAGKATARIAVGDEPWHLALTPDGKRLAVGNALSGDVSVVDADALKVLYTVPLGGRNLRHVAVSPDGAWAYVPYIAEKGLPTTVQNIERGHVIGARLARVPLRGEGPREAIALDPNGFAVGDLEGVAVAPGGERIAVTVGGTRDVLLLRAPLPWVSQGVTGDLIDPVLHKDRTRFRREKLRGRPLGIRFTPDGRQMVVANNLFNRVQVVDWESGQVAREVALGGPAEPVTPERRGEAIFYDAFKSWHEWFSCHTCHTDGHTNGGSYDTFNDGKYGNGAKKTLSLRGVSRTAPWTWHGKEKNLGQSAQGSFSRTMGKATLSDVELRDLIAYLKTLDFVPPVGRAADGSFTEGARRGEAVFKGKACDSCHEAPDYTSAEVFLVGLEEPGDAYKGFNPPPLRGVGARAPFLHNGKAKTLEEVLQTFHRPSKVNGKPDCTPDELRDLVEFLRQL